MRSPGRRVLPQRPVRAMRGQVTDVLAENEPEMTFARDQHPVQAFAGAGGQEGTENLCHQVILVNHASGTVAPLDLELI